MHMAGPQHLFSSLTKAALCSWTASSHVAAIRSFSCSSSATMVQAAATAVTVGGLVSDLSKPIPYEPPAWAGPDVFTNPPRHGRLQLANLPTPCYRLAFSKIENKQQQQNDEQQEEQHDDSSSWSSLQQRLQKKGVNMNLYIKRDDSTGGVELGGNKIRKLEFLLADAVQQQYDSVVTIGGEQSNHARATAAACRMLQLEPHLILRTRQMDPIQKLQDNLVGNLLVDRLIGSRIYTVTPGEYGRLGSNEIVNRLCQHLTTTSSPGKMPYPIPVGGSNGIGTWGYINAVEELLQQWQSIRTRSCNHDASEQSSSSSSSITSSPSLDHIVFACGSGGTATGIVLGIALAYHFANNGKVGKPKMQQRPPMLHAIGVCDDPNYFYGYMTKIANEMGFVVPPPPPSCSSSSSTTSWSCTESFIRAHVTVHQGKGLGYALATEQELAFIMSFARETGIILDPVYTGKALYHFLHSVVVGDNDKDNDSEIMSTFQNSNVLFWHTGGTLGLYDKCHDLLTAASAPASSSASLLNTSLLAAQSPCQRLDFYGKMDNGAIDLSRPSE